MKPSPTFKLKHEWRFTIINVIISFVLTWITLPIASNYHNQHSDQYSLLFCFAITGGCIGIVVLPISALFYYAVGTFLHDNNVSK